MTITLVIHVQSGTILVAKNIDGLAFGTPKASNWHSLGLLHTHARTHDHMTHDFQLPGPPPAQWLWYARHCGIFSFHFQF